MKEELENTKTTNEQSNKKTTKEQLKRKSKTASIVILIFIAIFALAPGFGTIWTAIKTAKADNNTVVETTIEDNSSTITTISDEEDAQDTYAQIEELTGHPVSNTYEAIIAIVQPIAIYIAALFALHFAYRIVYRISKTGEPFSEYSLKNMKKLIVCADIVWIFSNPISITFVFAVLLSVLYYVFKYGCELQLDIDETV